jgi:hypothetical protein
MGASVPVAVPSEVEPEGEDVEEDREPEKTVRGVETDTVSQILLR